MKVLITSQCKKKLKNEEAIKRTYGQLSEAIMVSLSVLESVDSLAEVPNLPPTRRHKLSDGTWALDLSKNWRMIIMPACGSIPEEITEVEVINIIDYH